MLRIQAFSIFLSFLVLGSLIASAADEDPIAERVNQARTAYEEEVEAIRKDVLEELDALEAREKKKPKVDSKRTDAIEAERTELGEEGKIPKSVSSKLKTRISKNRSTFVKVLTTAKNEYTRLKKTAEAESLATELKEINASGLPRQGISSDEKVTPPRSDGDPPDKVPRSVKKAIGPKLPDGPVKTVVADGTRAGEVLLTDPKLGLKLVWCPAGRFKMGSPANEPNLQKDESPQVDVTFTRGFWMGQTEVTQGQWLAVMGAKTWIGQAQIVPEGGRYPITHVHVDNGMEFCQKLNELEQAAGRLPDGWSYTLPTDAQWEYACRAGTKTRYSFGDNEDGLADYGWYYSNSDKKLHEVGLKRPNAWGLFDMHGNLAEWCRDRHTETLSGGIDPVNPPDSNSGILRGGQWNAHGWYPRSANREQSYYLARSDSYGIRIALVREPSAKPPATK